MSASNHFYTLKFVCIQLYSDTNELDGESRQEVWCRPRWGFLTAATVFVCLWLLGPVLSTLTILVWYSNSKFNSKIVEMVNSRLYNCEAKMCLRSPILSFDTFSLTFTPFGPKVVPACNLPNQFHPFWFLESLCDPLVLVLPTLSPIWSPIAPDPYKNS